MSVRFSHCALEFVLDWLLDGVHVWIKFIMELDYMRASELPVKFHKFSL